MQIKHYSIFNSVSKKLNWATLRDDEAEDDYFLPYSREEYLKKSGYRTTFTEHTGGYKCL